MMRSIQSVSRYALFKLSIGISVVKFCIRKSVDLTMSLKADRNDVEGTQNKYRAIEDVILENGNAKTAAMNYGVSNLTQTSNLSLFA